MDIVCVPEYVTKHGFETTSVGAVPTEALLLPDVASAAPDARCVEYFVGELQLADVLLLKGWEPMEKLKEAARKLGKDKQNVDFLRWLLECVVDNMTLGLDRIVIITSPGYIASLMKDNGGLGLLERLHKLQKDLSAL